MLNPIQLPKVKITKVLVICFAPMHFHYLSYVFHFVLCLSSAQYNPQQPPAVGVPYAPDASKYGAPETVSRGGRAPSKAKLGFLEGL